MNFDLQTVKQEIAVILGNSKQYHNIEVLKQIFSLIDLTSLSSTDHSEHIKEMIEKVNQFKQYHPNIPQVAAVCVYPNFVETVKKHLKEGVRIASVAGGFPASQTFLSVKMAESQLAVEKGADEIDIVLSIGKFLNGEEQAVMAEIAGVKKAIGNAHLKVILESGLMPDLNSVFRASLLSINAGADFIKTSTGKEQPAATIEAIYVMCQAIKQHYEKTGVMIGLKPAGGISTTEEAILYYTVVAEVLGEKWINNQYFRIGASRLANHLLEAIYRIEKQEFKPYF